MKRQSIFVCQNCGYQSMGFLGRCPECDTWDSMLEEVKEDQSRGCGVSSPAQPIGAIEIKDQERVTTECGEFDLVLGGGVVAGSVVLLGGKPGIGKSTVMLQVAFDLAKKGHVILYVSGEESLAQIKMRANRLGVNDEPNLYLLSETNFEVIKSAIESIRPKYLIIDSIQVVYDPVLSSSPGTISQVKECARKLSRIAKENTISTFLIGHVTKEGSLAGPMVLEHIVDTVLYFEGESFLSHRILRAVKNRFGSTNEIGLFEMSEGGLKEVKNPSSLFLLDEGEQVAGNVIVSTLEGTRPLLVQIQALVAKSYLGIPLRRTIGLDHNRVSLLTAVLERRGKFGLYNQDIYVNVVGGLKINEPAVDLGVVLTLASSLKNSSLDHDLVVFGEVGLAGEVRKVNFAEKRIREAIKLGFKTCMVPCGNLLEKSKLSIKIIEVSNIREALQILE
ncbi:MAG: DNA repair protein RadA [Candidatus Saelkia tenebricola]|nr:DNA repair protein RadA [Candidatus Saelkia tenebricola]